MLFYCLLLIFLSRTREVIYTESVHVYPFNEGVFIAMTLVGMVLYTRINRQLICMNLYKSSLLCVSVYNSSTLDLCESISSVLVVRESVQFVGS